MPLRRGVVYAVAERAAEQVQGALLLTNNLWNDRMEDVGVVFVTPPRLPESDLEPVISQRPPLQAYPAAVRSFPKDLLGRPLAVLAPDQLARVEDALCALLAFPHLFADPPQRPPQPPGPITYPCWGNLYYVAGEQYGGESKRYLVVSHDHWNARRGKVLAVRTTTSTRWPQTSFPIIQRSYPGQAQACCGNLGSFPAQRFQLRRSFREQWLPLSEMRAVAEGIVETHALEQAIDRLLP